MTLKNISRLVLACLLALSCTSSIAQNSYFSQSSLDRGALQNFLKYKKTKEEGGNLLKWWRGESTIGTAFGGPLTYSHQSRYDSTDLHSTPSHDTGTKGTAKSQFGVHVNGNVNYMITRLGQSSILSFSWGLQADVLRWKFNGWDGNTLKLIEQNVLTANVGIPLTIDYKWVAMWTLTLS